MYNCPRAATIRAVTAVSVWAMDRQTFRYPSTLALPYITYSIIIVLTSGYDLVSTEKY
jgi:CRP-like cAMP-binding protein